MYTSKVKKIRGRLNSVSLDFFLLNWYTFWSYQLPQLRCCSTSRIPEHGGKMSSFSTKRFQLNTATPLPLLPLLPKNRNISYPQSHKKLRKQIKNQTILPIKPNLAADMKQNPVQNNIFSISKNRGLLSMETGRLTGDPISIDRMLFFFLFLFYLYSSCSFL